MSDHYCASGFCGHPSHHMFGRQHRGCDACDAMWDDRWVDLIVTDDAWQAISPKSDDGESGGYLCAGCVSERLLAAGLTGVPVNACGPPFWNGITP